MSFAAESKLGPYETVERWEEKPGLLIVLGGERILRPTAF